MCLYMYTIFFFCAGAHAYIRVYTRQWSGLYDLNLLPLESLESVDILKITFMTNFSIFSNIENVFENNEKNHLSKVRDKQNICR